MGSTNANTLFLTNQEPIVLPVLYRQKHEPNAIMPDLHKQPLGPFSASQSAKRKDPWGWVTPQF